MWLENEVFAEDMELICRADSVRWQGLRYAAVLVTGATGLIGRYLVGALAYYNLKCNGNIRIFALVRDLKKAKKMYASLLRDGVPIHFLSGQVEDFNAGELAFDYIIHGAGPTSSSFFLEKPVETVKTAVLGTLNILEIARQKKIKGMVYLSSMEAYGTPHDDGKITEEDGFSLLTMNPRNSYPESKRLCENLCAGYASEHELPVSCIRLTQTFGPGIEIETDQRVFAQFIRAYLKGEDIVLLTEGKSSRNYLYLADAVTAVLTVLTSGRKCELYNAANENTYCSILQMAELVANDIAGNKIHVMVKAQEHVGQYMPELHMNLTVKKLQALGWSARYGLKEMYLRTIKAIDSK